MVVPNAGKRLLETEAELVISSLERLLTRDDNDMDILRATMTKWLPQGERERSTILVINVVVCILATHMHKASL